LEQGIKAVSEKRRKESEIAENEPEEVEQPQRVAPPIPPRPMLEAQKSEVDQADSGM